MPPSLRSGQARPDPQAAGIAEWPIRPKAHEATSASRAWIPTNPGGAGGPTLRQERRRRALSACFIAIRPAAASVVCSRPLRPLFALQTKKLRKGWGV